LRVDLDNTPNGKKPATSIFESPERRLQAAIMFTDIVGYTSLTERNEPLALEILEEHRRILRPLFLEFNGKEIKTMGDAFLLVFLEASDAVRCAYEMQKSFHLRNLHSNNEKAIKIRVGIHYGNVIYREDERDVYGNCVNISSRIEPLADPGGICISGQVYDLISERIKDLTFENLGEHDLKNVEAPISIFKVTLPWEEQSRSNFARKFETETRTIYSTSFVDRDQEKSRLSKILEQMTTRISQPQKQEGRKLILISGEAGIGKTRLVNWFVSECMLYGIDVARGFCQADIAIPYFPFSEAFGKFLGEHQSRPLAGPIDVASWLKVLSRAGGLSQTPASRDSMFEGTLRLLERLSRQNPIALFLEDIHWSDESSLGLLHYLARNITSLNVLIVCTFRTEELSNQSSEGRPHPLRESLMLMSREGLYDAIELLRLDKAFIKEIATSVLGRSPRIVLESLAKESEGNPLFAIEYARLLKEEKGGLGPRREHNTNEGSLKIPQSVYDVILRRLTRLTHEQRRLVNCASLIGEKFEPQIVSDTLGQDRLETLELLDQVARETRILREEIEGRVVTRFFFDHAKIREVVLKELSSSLKMELHRRIAFVLFETYQEDRLEEVIFHYHEIADDLKVLELAPLAGDRARLKYAYSDSLLFYNWALEAANRRKKKKTVPTDVKVSAFRLQALIGRAEANSGIGRNEQALQDALEVLNERCDLHQRLQAIRICAESCFDIGHFTEALEFCEMKEVEGHRGKKDSMIEVLRIKHVRARIIGYRGETKTAVSELAETAKKLEALGAGKEHALALLSEREFQLTLFDMEGALRSAGEAKSIFVGLGDLEGEMFACQSIASVFASLGDVEKADTNYSSAAELANKLGLHGSLTWIYLYWGLLHEANEDYQKGLNLTLKALENSKHSQQPYVETAIWASLTRFYIRANRARDAENACIQMNRLFREHGKDASLTLQSAVQRSLGMYYSTRRESKLADSEYLSSIELARKGPMGPYHEVGTRMEYAQFLIEQHRVTDANEQLQEALHIYQKLGNRNGISRVNDILSLKIK
jgi:class 3 adenylate cyclase/tetratricopeptide (TPR) repeat protein